MMHIKPKRLISLITILAIASLSNLCLAALEPGEGENDFYITLDEASISELPISPSGTRQFENGYWGNQFNQEFTNIHSSPVSIYLKTHVNNYNKNKDFGFISTTGSNSLIYEDMLTITQYDGKKKYIKSIEIGWSNIKYCGGTLRVFASESDVSPYQTPSSWTESTLVEFGEEINKIDEILTPTEDGKPTLYTFKEPVNYLALARHAADGKYIARFSYLKIHFTDEWEDGNGGSGGNTGDNGDDGDDNDNEDDNASPVKIHLGDISEDNQKLDVEWSRYGTEISTGLTITYDESVPEEKRNLTLSDLSFTLTPQFEAKEKPDTSGEMPEGFMEQSWRLYQLLEGRDDILYDGYLETTDPITSGTPQILDDESGVKLKFHVPCSGLYQLDVECINQDFDLEIEKNNQPINIYSGIRNSYEDLALSEDARNDPIFYFCVNWVAMRNWTENILEYPHDYNLPDQPHSPTTGYLYIPGLYDAQIYFKIDDEDDYDGNNHAPMRANDTDTTDEDGFKLYTDETSFNLANLKDGKLKDMELRIKKNGSVTPMMTNGTKSETNFAIKLTDGSFEEALAVSNIDAENKEIVEYYNLNGLRIKPEFNYKGIVIRKTGNKVEKVIL